MKFIRQVSESPFPLKGKTKAALKLAVSGSEDYYGANSLENFSSASGLTYTHEDAQGFLDYPTSFHSANFWFKDAGVKVWEYEEAYDNWQDTYGMDSVMVFYHSGHGNMDSHGVFQAPLGAKWDNRDWAFSNQMAFSNEELRYLFWSTCFSLRVSGSNNPVKTWWNPNKGNLRMLFGYETTSIDAPEYGQFFWDEWKKGKTFARAFLDASWRISHDQVPVVMAVGANQNDAINRLNTERFFSRLGVPKGWYQWQWIGTIKSPKSTKNVGKRSKALIFDKGLFNDERLSKIANIFGFSKLKAATIQFDDQGNRQLQSNDARIFVSQRGALNIHVGDPNLHNHELIAESKALNIAKRMIRDLDFDKNIELVQGNIRHKFTCGGTMEGSGRMDEPSAVETIIQFRQAYNGVESVNSDHGLIAITVDNDGKVTNVYNSCKSIVGETDKPKSIIKSPPANGKSGDEDVEREFQKSIRKIVNRNTTEDNTPSGKYTVLRERAGYDFSGNLGLIVHQKDVEITLGSELSKRYKLRVPIMG